MGALPGRALEAEQCPVPCACHRTGREPERDLWGTWEGPEARVGFGVALPKGEAERSKDRIRMVRGGQWLEQPEERWRDILPLVPALKFLLSWGESKAESWGDLGRAGSQRAFGMPGGYKLLYLTPRGRSGGQGLLSALPAGCSVPTVAARHFPGWVRSTWRWLPCSGLGFSMGCLLLGRGVLRPGLPVSGL